MSYSESDTRANYIDPCLVATGWQAINIRREHYFTDGRKLFGGKRGKRCFVDYLLIHNKTFIGIVEAKSEDKEPTEGLQQAIEYAQKLRVRFIYSTNGRKIYQFDLREGKGDYITDYPSPDELYAKAVSRSSPLKDTLLNTPFYIAG